MITMELGGRKHRRRPRQRPHQRRHNRNRHRPRGYRATADGTMTAAFRIPGRFASTVYAVLLIIAIVLVSFGFPLVLLGMVFMFEGLSYQPSITGVMCVVMGAAGVAFGMLICRYTHKKALRVPQNKIGVAPTRTGLQENGVSVDTQTDAEERQDTHQDMLKIYGDTQPAQSISWSELSSVESRDSAYGGYFRPVVPASSKSRVFTIHPTSREFVLDGAALLRPPKAPDNYTVPPLSATPPILYKIEKDGNISLEKKSTDSVTP